MLQRRVEAEREKFARFFGFHGIIKSIAEQSAMDKQPAHTCTTFDKRAWAQSSEMNFMFFVYEFSCCVQKRIFWIKTWENSLRLTQTMERRQQQICSCSSWNLLELRNFFTSQSRSWWNMNNSSNLCWWENFLIFSKGVRLKGIALEQKRKSGNVRLTATLSMPSKEFQVLRHQE